MFKFENLEVWKRAVKLTVTVHNLTQQFPKEELYVLTAQIKRAADSVALNIAEGSTGQSNAEFKQFIGYAIRSAVEVVSCLYIGMERNIIAKEDFTQIYFDAETVVKMLQSLRKSIR